MRHGFSLGRFVLGITFGSSASAQETVLSGIVTDDTDAVLPGVTVTAQHVASGNRFVGVTDLSGEDRIGGLRPGVYNVLAELAGFTSPLREGVELLLGQRAILPFKLAVSTVQESVTVTGQAPLLDTTQSQLGGNIDVPQVQELPVNGRNWLDLAMLAPGSRTNTGGNNSPAKRNSDDCRRPEFSAQRGRPASDVHDRQ